MSFGRIHPDKATADAIEIARRAGRPLTICGPIHDATYFRERVEPHIDGERVRYLDNVGGPARPRSSAAPPVSEAVSDAQRLSATRPSRYCPSDRMAGFARAHFGHLGTGSERVRDICDYVWQRISYRPASQQRTATRSTRCWTAGEYAATSPSWW
jgi:hypothetical protein